MKTLEKGAIYVGDRIIGFECSECGDIYPSMIGDVCHTCRKEMKNAANIKSIANSMKLMSEVIGGGKNGK